MSQQFDDLVQSVESLQDALGSYTSDDLDNIITNQQQDESDIADLKQTAGQLTLPLTPDTMSIIYQLFPTGSFQLVAGQYILQDDRISASSKFFYSTTTPNYGAGTLFYTITKTQGQIVIQSSLGSDVSTFDYLLIP